MEPCCSCSRIIPNANSSLDHHALCTPAMLLRRKKEFLFPDLSAIESGQSEWHETQDQAAGIKREAATITPGKHVPLLAFLGLASVLKQVTYTVYPDVQYVFRQMFHQRIEPIVNLTLVVKISILRGLEQIMKKNVFLQPNHFVPLFNS